MGLKRSAKGKPAQKATAAGGASRNTTKGRPSKRTQGGRKTTKSTPGAPPAPLNQVPTEIQTVLVFGCGENGELGLGPKVTESLVPRAHPFLDPDDPAKVHIVQIACGGMHTVVLTADNRIVTWGVNDSGALGRNTEWDEQELRDINSDSGDDASDEDEDGDLNPLESTPTEIPSHHFAPGTQFVQVAAGDSCSFALTDAGLVYGWGTFRNASGDERFGYDADGKPIGRQTTPALIPGISKITQLACGVNHVLALDASGNIWGWGANEQNQLGRRLFTRNQDSYAPTQVRVCRGDAAHIASGDYHSFAVDGSDNVWGWGLNSYGEAAGGGGDPVEEAGTGSAVLPHPTKIRALCGRGVVLLDGGAHHSGALTAAGECLLWGRMDGGQLGVALAPDELQDASLVRHDARGRPAVCLRPARVRDVTGEVAHVACGADHTIFVTKDGCAYATGFGSQGQLGLGSYEDVDVAQRINVRGGRRLTWAGAGGQFSVVAGPAKAAR